MPSQVREVLAQSQWSCFTIGRKSVGTTKVVKSFSKGATFYESRRTFLPQFLLNKKYENIELVNALQTNGKGKNERRLSYRNFSYKAKNSPFPKLVDFSVNLMAK